MTFVINLVTVMQQEKDIQCGICHLQNSYSQESPINVLQGLHWFSLGSFGKRRHLQVILVFFFTGYAVFDKAASGKDNKVTLMKYT